MPRFKATRHAILKLSNYEAFSKWEMKILKKTPLPYLNTVFPLLSWCDGMFVSTATPD